MNGESFCRAILLGMAAFATLLAVINRSNSRGKR